MEKLFDSISGFVDQKLKNPFINTFIIAWIAFNWRPIIFFIFSKQTAETKIWFITAKYSSIFTVLLYPVAWTIAVLIFIPLILLGVEYLTSFIIKLSKLVQKDLMINEITTQGEIAQEKDKTEKVVLAASKVGNVNLHISELKEKINIYENDLKNERTKNLELVKSQSTEVEELNTIITDLNEKLRNSPTYERSFQVQKDLNTQQSRRFEDEKKHLQSEITRLMLENNEKFQNHKDELEKLAKSKDEHINLLASKIKQLDAQLQAEKNKNS